MNLIDLSHLMLSNLFEILEMIEEQKMTIVQDIDGSSITNTNTKIHVVTKGNVVCRFYLCPLYFTNINNLDSP